MSNKYKFLNIVQSLNFQSPEPIIVCDDDQDGFTTLNLLSVLPSISTELDDFDIAFFTFSTLETSTHRYSFAISDCNIFPYHSISHLYKFSPL